MRSLVVAGHLRDSEHGVINEAGPPFGVLIAARFRRALVRERGSRGLQAGLEALFRTAVRLWVGRSPRFACTCGMARTPELREVRDLLHGTAGFTCRVRSE